MSATTASIVPQPGANPNDTNKQNGAPPQIARNQN